MPPTNMLIIMADQHNPKMLGSRGHECVKTPNLDALASRGTRFDRAYTNSPLCVPARASFATGRYVHGNGCWDNAIAYEGSQPSWGHRLQAAGNPVVSIGKLHYRSEEDDTGFDEQIVPMHIMAGVGDLHGSIRPDLPVRYQARQYVEEVGPGETKYSAYDRDITSRYC
jgi:choline-sulfatase